MKSKLEVAAMNGIALLSFICLFFPFVMWFFWGITGHHFVVHPWWVTVACLVVSGICSFMLGDENEHAA